MTHPTSDEHRELAEIRLAEADKLIASDYVHARPGSDEERWAYAIAMAGYASATAHSLLAANGPVTLNMPMVGAAKRSCRVCGCTEEDCSGCVERTGQPCWWAEPDLCSACVPAGVGG
jgi:hypothetical protein